MKNSILLLVTLLVIANELFAQPGALDLTFNSTDKGYAYKYGPQGAVYTSALQSDDKIIIGGFFFSYNETLRNKIARLNSDGSLDNTFNPGTGANDTIFATSVQSDGKIIIGGKFTSFNNISINRIARLNADGTLDNTFNPGTGPDDAVYSISLQSDGKIIITGKFRLYKGTSRYYIARLNADGSLDTSFNPGSGASNKILTSAIQSDGKIMIGGAFTSYASTTRYFLARLNADGSLDTSFDPGNTISAFPTDTKVNTIKILSDGKILAGGKFQASSKAGLVRFNSNGTLDNSFYTNYLVGNSNFEILTITVLSDGKLIIGGYLPYSSGFNRHIYRLTSNGSIDTAFENSLEAGYDTDDNIMTTLLLNDGKVIVGGKYTTYSRGSNFRLVRLNVDGSQDFSFNPISGANSQIIASAIQKDGKILIGGKFFTAYNGVGRREIARLNLDGSLDESFNPGSGISGEVWKITVLDNEKIMVAGVFYSYNGTSVNGFIRLNSDGTLDPTFNCPSGNIQDFEIQQDGKIIIVGTFDTYNSVSRKYIARINEDGTLDETFNPGTGANNWVYNVAIQSDGKYVITGSFTAYNGTSINRVARLNADGSLDNSFNVGTGLSDITSDILIQKDGKLVITGYFTTYNDATVNRIVRLNTDGTMDMGFNTGTGANNSIRTALLLSDEKLIIGGNFLSFNGTSTSGLVRLNTDGTIDNSFQIGTETNNPVITLSAQADGRIVFGGYFTAYNGIGRNYLARIHSNAPIPSEFVTGPSLVSKGQTGVAYSVPQVEGLTYVWNYTGTGATINVLNPPSSQGNKIAANSGNSITIDFAADASSGTLEVIANNGCCLSDPKKLEIVVQTATSVANSLSNKIQCYPNPTAGKLSIDLGESYNSVELEITNSSGTLIKRVSHTNIQTIPFEINGPEGLYFVSIKKDGQLKCVLKIIKE